MKIKTDGQVFRNSDNKHVIYNGINLVCKEKSLNYLGGYDEDLFRKFSQWGFNLIRLGIIWDGVEPQPLQYDDNYINEIKKYMDLCYKFGIDVFLDMHQDLYSVKYSDGAPEWATLNEEKEHITGDVWSDSYLLSPAVQTSFDNFWGNTKINKELGLLDYYSKTWIHILLKLGDHPALIGCDFLNEPFPGSEAVNIYGAMFYSFGQVLGTANGTEIGPTEVADIFSNPEKMAEALTTMDDYELYSAAVIPMGEYIKDFDSNILNRFYCNLTEKLRKSGYTGIIMQENNYFSNAGVPSQIELIQNNGTTDTAQAFSPHGYDLVVDTEGVGALSSNARVDVIFDNHKNVQKRLNIPVIVGEWGAFAHYKDTVDQCRHIINLFEKNLWSNTYWCYHKNFESVPVLPLLKRGYPKAIIGELKSYHYDFETGRLYIEWDEGEITEGFSEIYLPHRIENSNLNVDNKKEFCLIKIEATGGAREIII